MIGYVTLGTNDISRAAKFYDTLLGALGAKRFMEGERFIVVHLMVAGLPLTLKPRR